MLFVLKIRLMEGHVGRITGFLWREWLSSAFFLEERENWEIEDYLKLPLIAGLATIRGLGGIENLEYKFKWTNDVYLENKKLCGILMEKTDNVYIVGIGINVNNILPEKLKNKAISLTQATNKKYKIDEIVKNIVSEFQILCENLGNGSWEEILKEINEINYLKNKKIELKFGNEKFVAGNSFLFAISCGKRMIRLKLYFAKRN